MLVAMEQSTQQQASPRLDTYILQAPLPLLLDMGTRAVGLRAGRARRLHATQQATS
jgi:hypothetical protein